VSITQEVVVNPLSKQKMQAQKDLRARLGSLNNCAIEWVSQQATETIGTGKIAMSFQELSEHSLELLAHGDGLDWIGSYIQGHWSSSNILQFLHQMVQKDQLTLKTVSLWRRSVLQLYKKWVRKSFAEAFDFLKAHHDLSDRFFEVFLDQQFLLYSPALYSHPQATLQQATQWQLQRICEKLVLLPTDHVLDAGSGWGGLGLYAAKYYGAKVTIASSSQQHEKLIQSKAYLMNIHHLVTVIDYKTAFASKETYNKIALLTPMQFIGHSYFNDIMEQLSVALKPEGLMVVQLLTQADHQFGALFEAFMQRYFFDSYTLHSLPQLCQNVSSLRTLKYIHLETMDEHVARTLVDWFQHLKNHRDQLLDTGLTPTFLRLYDSYLALFYAGVCTRKLQSTQILFAHKDYKGNDWLLSHAKSAYFPSPYLATFG
jgi:cyclopropane-fatty-acyl-phospholipid synthase